MPLLNKKRITFSTPIEVDTRRRRKQVYYLKCTNEAFSTYESYIKRWTLCHRPLWECERTGRQHLTYQQAKESEQTDQHRVEFKFCAVLRKQLLSHIQFQTIGLDNLVQNLFTSYLYDFATGEIILCFLGGHTYLGEILDIIPNDNTIKKEENGMTLQNNGRLRFPDAFLHPEPTPDSSSNDQPSGPNHQYRYKVQLIDNNGAPLEHGVRVLEADELCRDPQWFNPTILRRLVRECATRDGYIGAPWLLKDNVAKHYGVPTTLPTPLQETQDMAYYDIVRQRHPQLPLKYHHHQQQQHNNGTNDFHHDMAINGSTSSWSIHHHTSLHPDNNTSPSLSPTADTITFSPYSQLVSARDERREVDKQARKQEHLRLKIQQKLEKERIREERKKQAAVKYPIEDLDLPIYRKDPYRHWALVDMTPTSYSQQQQQQQQQQDTTDGAESNGIVSVRIPYPCGGRGPHPQPHLPSNLLTDEQFESMLAIWSFLTVFSVPLELPTMTIETFESSLLSTTTTTIHSFVSLLNVIIKERLQGTTSDIINGDQVEDYLQDNESSSDDDNDDDEDDNDSEQQKPVKEQQQQQQQQRQTRQSARNKTTTSVDTSKARTNTTTTKSSTTESSSPSVETSFGWRDPEPLRLCKDWDRKEIRADRKNWLVALIGCLNDVATPLLLPGIDELLQHLIPRPHSTVAERDRQFASLDTGHRLQLLSFLVDATNETLIIKNYMDKCQDQMTELRRQKVELNKEYKRLAQSKTTSEKKQPGRKSNSTNKESIDGITETNGSITPQADEDTELHHHQQQQQHNSDLDDGEDDNDDEDEDEDEEVDNDSDQTDGDSDDDDDDDDDEDPSDDDFAMYNNEGQNEKHVGKRKSKYGLLHQSRRQKLDQKKRQQAEAASQQEKRRRISSSSKKRTTKTKSKDTSLPPSSPVQKTDDPQPIEDKEQELKRKEEQLEREMRQYMTLRIRPLGKDRFFQRYFYLDNIGTPDHHGTGRLYVQAPTYVDILQLMDRDHHPSSNGVVSGPDRALPTAPAWGRGGGREFVLALMKEQGLHMECEWLAQRMVELQQQQETLDDLRQQSALSHTMCGLQPVLANHLHQQKTSNSWWYYYSDPEQIQHLLAWLNPKGVREYKLRNEIIKHQHYIVESMEKHDKAQDVSPSPPPPPPPSLRVTRGKKS